MHSNKHKLHLIAVCCLIFSITSHAQTIQKQTPDQTTLKSRTQPSPLNIDMELELPSWESRDEGTLTQTPQGNPISPPFGLKWGQNPNIIINWSKNKGYETRSFTDETGRATIEVNGPFKNVEFHTLCFYFTENTLSEVELRYPIKKSESEGLFQMARIKDILEKTRGQGRLSPESKGKTEGAYWRLNYYTWTAQTQQIWLVCFQAKKEVTISQTKNEIVSITSLHYKNLSPNPLAFSSNQ